MNRKASTLMSLGISIALIAAGIWFLCNHHAAFGYDDIGWAMPNYRMMTGAGLGLIKILFWAAVLSSIGLLISGVISIRRISGDADNRTITDAVNMLKDAMRVVKSTNPNSKP